MKRTILILLTLTALSLTGMAQDNNDQYHSRGGICNGRAWSAFSDDLKRGYVIGYNDHWGVTWEALSKTKEFHTEVAVIPQLTMGEIVKGLNAFYAEPANTNITVRDALIIFSAKVAGMSAADLQAATEHARKLALEQPKPLGKEN